MKNFRAVVIFGGADGVVEGAEWVDFSSAMTALIWLRGWLPETGEDSVWGWFTPNMVFRGWGAGFTWREFWVVDSTGAIVPIFLG